jgi:hypothetical protein
MKLAPGFPFFGGVFWIDSRFKFWDTNLYYSILVVEELVCDEARGGGEGMVLI